MKKYRVSVACWKGTQASKDGDFSDANTLAECKEEMEKYRSSWARLGYRPYGEYATIRTNGDIEPKEVYQYYWKTRELERLE